MLKYICRFCSLSILFFLSSCYQTTVTPNTISTSSPVCATYNGYGRYTMHINCETIIINQIHYVLTLSDSGDLVIGSHSLLRGIYHKTRPWLYVHQIENNMVDITFDEGKGDYPLYTGSSGSIFNVYEHPWEMVRSTCAQFANNYWLVSHRWSDAGIYFDLQKQIDPTRWSLIEEIFVPGDGSEVIIGEINSKVIINSFNAGSLNAMVQFTLM
jgi:hypothetical protein